MILKSDIQPNITLIESDIMLKHKLLKKRSVDA